MNSRYVTLLLQSCKSYCSISRLFLNVKCNIGEMYSYFSRQLLQYEILKNPAAICFELKKNFCLFTSDLEQTHSFLAEIAARFLNRNSDRKSRWLFLISFLFPRLNNMTDFNLWLLSSRLRHWPTYFHEIFFFFFW